ncbi:MAG: hypothetical protein WD490_04810, partial [Opitutales bacterium]
FGKKKQDTHNSRLNRIFPGILFLMLRTGKAPYGATTNGGSTSRRKEKFKGKFGEGFFVLSWGVLEALVVSHRKMDL